MNPYGDIALLDLDVPSNYYGEETTCHCGYAPLRRVIVSPSLARGTYQTQLRNVQRSALEALREAEEIYIVGYSLPVEDLMIRSLFLRGVCNHPEGKKVHVFQRSDEARPRYDLHFADYQFHDTGFDGFLAALAGSHSPVE